MTSDKRSDELLEKYGLHACNQYINSLNLPHALRKRIKSKCRHNWFNLPPAERRRIVELSWSESADLDILKKIVGFRTLNPKVEANLKTIGKDPEGVAECETEALKSPNIIEENEFRSWCYASIPEHQKGSSIFLKDDFCKGSKPVITDEFRDFCYEGIPSLPKERPNALFPELEEFKYSNRPLTPEPTSLPPIRSVFPTSKKVVEISNSVEPRAVPAPSSAPPKLSTRTITLTRKFGLKLLDKTKSITSSSFARFEKIENRMVRAGVTLPDALFAGKGVPAAKRFYDKVRKTPAMEALWGRYQSLSPRLIERVWRCAAPQAYFALRDYKTRARLLGHLIGILQSTSNLTVFFTPAFPQRAVYEAVYAGLPQTDMKLTKGQVSRVYLGNVLRWMRNLVKRGFRTKYAQVVADTFQAQPAPPPPRARAGALAHPRYAQVS